MYEHTNDGAALGTRDKGVLLRPKEAASYWPRLFELFLVYYYYYLLPLRPEELPLAGQKRLTIISETNAGMPSLVNVSRESTLSDGMRYHTAWCGDLLTPLATRNR